MREVVDFSLVCDISLGCKLAKKRRTTIGQQVFGKVEQQFGMCIKYQHVSTTKNEEMGVQYI